MNAPRRVVNTPFRSWPEDMQRVRGIGRSTGDSRRPSSIIGAAPPGPSSPGWNMKITLPASSSRTEQSRCAAPTSMPCASRGRMRA